MNLREWLPRRWGCLRQYGMRGLARRTRARQAVQTDTKSKGSTGEIRVISSGRISSAVREQYFGLLKTQCH